MTQCDKQKFCLLQWLSATKENSVCRSDSVRQTILKKISNLFVACNKEIGKKAKNKHPSKFEFHQRYQIALGYLINTIGTNQIAIFDIKLNFSLKKGASVTFKYRLVVAGEDLSDKQIDKLADEYAKL